MMASRRFLLVQLLLAFIASSVDGVDHPTYDPQRCYNVHVDDFRAFVAGIWDADAAYRVTPSPNNHDMVTNFQPKNPADPNSLLPFFSQPIDENKFDNVIYKSFAPLLADDVHDDHQAHLFISAIIASDVGQTAIQLMPEMDEQNFRAGLFLLLFGNNWKIFNHVFRGERKPSPKKITGYHNWYKFYTQERAHEIKYMGSLDAAMVQVLEARNERHFFMGSFKTTGAPVYKKPFGTFFIGTSPAFEAVLYYYVHVHGCWGIPFFLRAGLRDRTCIAGFYDSQFGDHPPTSFPVVETAQDSCEKHKMQMIGPFPQLLTTTTTTQHPPTTSTSTTTGNPPEPPKEDGVGKYFQLIYKSIESFLERAKLFTSDVLKKLVAPMKEFKDKIKTQDDVPDSVPEDSAPASDRDKDEDQTTSRSSTDEHEEGVEEKRSKYL